MQYKITKNKIKRNALFHILLYTYRKKAKRISPKSRIVSLIKKLVNPTIGSRVSFNITRRGEFACRAGRKGKSSTWTFLPCHPVERKKSEREREIVCA